MATKWKGWTANRAVKGISFLSLLALLLLAVNQLLIMIFRWVQTGIGVDIVFMDAAWVYDHAEWAVRYAYIWDFAIIGGCLLLMIGFFAILLAGAGRKCGDSEVHFSLLDRIYLDIGLGALFAWIAVLFLFAQAFNWWIFPVDNFNQIATHILVSAMVLALALPALLWFLSFVKHVKAGAFWRHTLIFFFLNWGFIFLKRGTQFVMGSGKSFFVRMVRGIWNFIKSFFTRIVQSIRNFIKSLWAGTNLTNRVALIGAASFGLLFFTGIVGATTWHTGSVALAAFLAAAVVVYFLLRYARRIHELDKYAQAVSDGAYDAEANVGGGELGSIATSIGNMSAGIHRAVEERMKSERLKTELITNVSHDIRTPLTSIITYTDLLKSEGLTCEKAPEYLTILAQKADRLKILTDELFEASKAATGNIDVTLTELDFVHLMNQVLGELDNAVKSSGLDLRVNLPERLYIIADGKLLWRVMENLMSNVFKYAMPNSRVYLDAKQGGSEICVQLKNISAEPLNIDAAELTERFKRGDDSRTDGGFGLGLSIAQSFIDAQNGTLTVSIDGDLFKVTIYLPSS